MALGVWTRLQSLMFGGAIGAAASEAMAPPLEPARQHAWLRNPNKILSAREYAQLVAQALVNIGDVSELAARNGFDAVKLANLIELELVAIPYAEALELWRRGKIDKDAVYHALAKGQVDQRYWEPLLDLYFDRLDPAVIAVAIQRGIMADPGFLPVAPPSGEGKVPAFPVSPLDPIEEAKASGIGSDRLFVETAIVGNPASPDLAARLVFRGIIDKVDYARAIAEGNTRNEWGDPIFEGFRQILTADNYVAARLRAWIDDEQLHAGAALHGMTPDDADLLLLIHGRPLSWHQVWIGLQRGGIYDGPTGHIDPPFLKALQESDIRPEWYNLAWAQRYSYPSAFVTRALAKGGEIDYAETLQILTFEGWEPELAKKVATSWTGGTSTAASTPTKSYTTAAVKAISNDYVLAELTQEEAAADLTKLGVDAAGQKALFEIWDVLKKTKLKTLTDAQLRTAYRKGALDEATVLARLEALGLSPADAQLYLAT